MKRYDAYIVLAMLFLTSSAWAQSTPASPVQNTILLEGLPEPEYFANNTIHHLAKLLDKSGAIYFLDEASHLDHGFAANSIYLIHQGDNDSKQEVYKSIYDAESGGCYFGERRTHLTEHNIDPDTVKFSYFSHRLITSDIDSDLYTDLVLLTREQDCVSQTYRFIGFIISPQKEGFKVTAISTRGD